MIAASTAVLGAGAGALMARCITDETEWYQRYFFIAAAALAVTTPFTLFVASGSYNFFLSLFAGLLFAGIFILGLYVTKPLIVTLAATALLLIGSVGTWQVMLLALMPATGYLYPKVNPKSLAWFILMPIITVLWTVAPF